MSHFFHEILIFFPYSNSISKAKYMLIEFLVIVISNKEFHQMAITVQNTINKNWKKKIQKLFPKKKRIPTFFFFFFFLQKGLKQNHKIAGITNCEITKCGDPLYSFLNLETVENSNSYRNFQYFYLLNWFFAVETIQGNPRYIVFNAICRSWHS